ncbi:MAG: PrsW family intramembrane metalloprotease [Bacteroidales bacterium]|nr:PrsW family intramembrane metalloprotease [Bacteroidales bacterium]
MTLLILALAPVLILLVYVYIRDKYEREPISLLLKGLGLGALIVIPVIFAEKFLQSLPPDTNTLFDPAYTAFVVAGFTEELFKFLALYFLIWKNPNFNEKFDGIVYAVFISLGFAAIENIMYVMGNGVQTGYLRAFTAVPAHALFGVAMGYYFGLAKFQRKKRSIHMYKAFLIPIILHGVYDFIIMSQLSWWLFVFLPYLYYLWDNGLKKMRELSDHSRFNPDNANGLIIEKTEDFTED